MIFFWPLSLGLTTGIAFMALFGLYVYRQANKKLELAKQAAEHELTLSQAKIQSLEKDLQVQSLNLESIQNKLSLEFTKTQKLFLEESTLRLHQLGRDSLTQIVNPLDQELKFLKERIQDVYDREARERISLKKELEFMVLAQQKMTLEAQSLTKALRGDVKAQGLWGEVILERILESSGLRQGEEFIVQGQGLGLKAEDGQTLRPDVLVLLPGQRNLVIDSKVSLKSYELHINSETENEKRLHLQEFLSSVRRHIEELSQKNYASLYNVHSPDFILMFMPTDGAFSLAHQSDASLFSYAMEKRIAIVSPSLLFPNLRTVEAIWRQERQSKNSEEIARQAGGLYDKFVGLLEDVEALETYLKKASETRHSLLSKIKEGRGNLLDRVENLRTLGAKTKKRLPESTDVKTEIPPEMEQP